MGEKNVKSQPRPDRTREVNRGRVLTELRRDAPLSRTQIASLTGLSAATVSAITADFLDEGLVITDATHRAGRGRPMVSLTLNPEAAMVCTVYFGLRAVAVTFIDYAGEVAADFSFPHSGETLDRGTIRNVLIGGIEKALARLQTTPPLSRVAVGFQGVTSVDGLKVLWSPITRERDLPIASWLEDAFSVPTLVSNDCDMMVRALNWREPERYGRNFATILLAHGVGMGLFLRGEIVNGTKSSGIEFGHMTHVPDGALCRCGKRGCIEAYAGDYAIERAASGQSETAKPVDMLQSPDLEKIRDAALAGDTDALASIEAAGNCIGSGIANLYALVDEFPVALVGAGTVLFDLMEDPIRNALATAPGASSRKSVDIACYLDDGALVREGCAVAALMEDDTANAVRKAEKEKVA